MNTTELRDRLSSILISHEYLLSDILYANYAPDDLARRLADIHDILDNIDRIVIESVVES